MLAKDQHFEVTFALPKLGPIRLIFNANTPLLPAAMYTRPPPVTGCTLRGSDPFVGTLAIPPLAFGPAQP